MTAAAFLTPICRPAAAVSRADLRRRRLTLPDLGLSNLADAHGRWRIRDARQLGSDRLEVYDRARADPGDPPMA